METRPELDGFLERIRIDFAYDWKGRRVQKKVQVYENWLWSAVDERNFHYHGWNLVAELDVTGTVLKSYLWGLDLSGTLEGAGALVDCLRSATMSATTFSIPPTTATETSPP